MPEAEDEQLEVDDEEDDDGEDDDEDAFDDIDGLGDRPSTTLIGIAGQAGALMSAPSSETDERLRRLETAAARAGRRRGHAREPEGAPQGDGRRRPGRARPGSSRSCSR